MPSDSPINLLDVLDELLQLAPKRREGRLDELGLSPGDRAEVESWLRQSAGAEGFLETPPPFVREAMRLLQGRMPGTSGAVDSRTLDLASTELPSASEKRGTRIGCYELLDLIGEGGFGSVFHARQEHPVRRDVALKIIKLGMDTRQVIARFEAERQALAMMNHPHIARVLDAGATDTGRPYFVMELVEGVPITRYCDDRKMSIRKRLELFAQVCQAVQHAHTKGIIHRDLKPSNILVGLVDGKSVPKIIDFGIAKATQRRLTEQAITTAQWQWMGTPQYMSPEQADASRDIDTRSDICVLGVLLYELLSGHTPFAADELASKSYPEVRKIICEREPPALLTRLGSAGQTIETLASCRATDPPKLRKLLTGELDWIVHRCLEKDRNRRYETAAALALDVRHYLHDEPVTARQPGAVYRLRKLVRRNRVAFGAGTSVMLALVVGLTVSTWAMRQAIHAEHSQTLLREDAEANAYASDLLGVQQALSVYNLRRARMLLDRHRPKPGQKDRRGWEWRYLWRQCRGEAKAVLCRRPLEISSFATSRDGRWLAVGAGEDESVEGTVSIWDVAARKEVISLPTGPGRARVAFSPSGPFLAYSSSASNADSNWQRIVTLYDYSHGTAIATALLNQTCVALRFSPDGTTLLTSTAGENGRLTLWRTRDLSVVRSFAVPNEELTAGMTNDVAFAATADGTAAAVAPPGRIRVVDLNTGAERWSKDAQPTWVASLAFSPDGRVLAVGTSQRVSVAGAAIYLHDAATGELLGPPLEGHLWMATDLQFWPDGKTLASAGFDQTVRLWNVSDPAHPRSIRPPLTGHASIIRRLALLSDNKTIVSGAGDGSVCLWDTSAAQFDPSHLILPGVTWNFSSDGASLITLDRHGHVSRRGGLDFQEMQPILALGQEADLAMLNDHGRFVRLCLANASRVWDLRSLHELPREPAGLLNYWAMTPERRFLLYFRDGNRAMELDPTTGRVLASWHPVNGIAAYGATPDGRWRLAIGREGIGTISDIDGHMIAVDLQQQRVSDAQFSPDGRVLAVAGRGVVGLWNTAELAVGGKLSPTATLGGDLTAAPNRVGFSPDGRRLAATGQESEAVKVFDVQSHQELLTLAASGQGFWQVAFSADGRILGACNQEGELHLWRAPTLAEIDAAEAAERGGAQSIDSLRVK